MLQLHLSDQQFNCLLKGVLYYTLLLLYIIITLHLLIVAKKTFYCNDHTITEFGITDKNSSTAYIVLYKWIDSWFLDSNRREGVWSLPWRWHILSIPLTTGRGTSAETCGLDDVFPADDLGSRPEALCWYICIYIYMYVHSLYEFCYRSYIQRECHSVLAKGSARFLDWMPRFVVFGLPIVSCSLIKI